MQCSEGDKRAIFTMIDRDGSGSICASELRQALRSSGAIKSMYDGSLRTFGTLIAATLAFDVGVFALCACASVAYALKKTWYLNNLLGAAFSIQGIEMISLGSYVIGCLLLCGLFVYDVFWVFGTEVMVAVAKNLNAPVKILFPKAVNVTPIPVSMLGLGDIVIPGIFVALMLRFDAHLKLGSTPYFASNLAAYVVGLGVTIGVMHFFDAAQPALLYLVPACIGASLLTAAARGEVQTLLNFSVEKPKDAKED